MDTLGRHYLDNTLARLRRDKDLAEGAFAQLEPEDFHTLIDPEANSIAILIRHLAGNMRSRWRGFPSSDGEKSDRDRDSEFLDSGEGPEALLARWQGGWDELFAALEALAPGDLLATITIRGEPHTVLEAIQRQLTHYAYHVGQIVLLAKHLRGERWRSLSIPKGGSQRFNAELGHAADEAE